MFLKPVVLDDVRRHRARPDADTTIEFLDISAQLWDSLEIDDHSGPFGAFSEAHEKIGASRKETHIGSVDS